ncbi:putative lipoprotein [Shewanella baltica OS625]|uniref:Lipoprotein, putative n=1 Tax=Shewanella baltica (strain OS195) TaxID=399599 RepID=A9KVC2_SHEB9|nr:hypothetical protein [Shewanella baltica]ABX47326.1 lipoprotein, putative [Shewanella baltica OS195]ADT92350.1 putative lipoprotein [Shewanella baltica OS678]EHC07643.1 putative lipoprotein [Shewanella baltica OS625]
MSLRPFIFTLAFILVFTAGVSLTGCIINVNAAGMPDLDHQQRELTLDSQDLQGLIAETGAGSLEIIGVEGLTQIKLVADIYSNKDSNDNKLILTLEKKANKAKLKADFEQSGFNNYSPYIDLKLQVPANLALDIDDGSGAILINKMTADINVKDGSGELIINGGNNVSIDDGSGDIEVSQINGNLKIDDGSGAIKVTDIRGNIAIDDGSGNIEVANVQSAVTITDGSGNINVFNTKGLTILAAGSGDVTFNKIDGPVSME